MLVEAQESLWVATSLSTSYPALDRNLKVDVAVVGLSLIHI